METAYGFVSPSGRSTLPLDLFTWRLSNAKWRAATVKTVSCEAEVCDVTVELEFDVLPNLPHKQEVAEKWILEAGKWWFVYRG